MQRIQCIFILWQGLAFLTFSCNAQVKTNASKENAGQLKLIKSQSKNSGDNVHCSLQDRQGNLWFVTTADGVYRYVSGHCRTTPRHQTYIRNEKN